MVYAVASFWPLSDRQIHYLLLGPNAPLKHASKPDSGYRNDIKSYRQLVDLVTRARVAGIIPWEAIDDETRPVDLNEGFWSPAEFFRQQFDKFLTGYWRHRQQSQPHHIEIIAEKLTVRSILEEVAQEYTIPLTITRGQTSLPPKKAVVDRYRRSHKDKLILLIVSDLDPAGEVIAEDWVKCMRRDFGIQNVEAFKIALTIDQVEDFDLEPSMEANEDSPTYQAFVDEYGPDAYVLEALDPADLAELLHDAIEKVMDLDLYNQELEAEETDSTQIIAELSPEQLDQIEEMSVFHCSLEEMAHAVGVCRHTMQDMTRRDPEVKRRIALGNSKGKRALRAGQFKVALSGNVTMLMYLGKCILGQVPDAQVHINSAGAESELSEQAKQHLVELARHLNQLAMAANTPEVEVEVVRTRSTNGSH